MTDREIRAFLRGATRDKILTGWQGPHHRRSYTISPVVGDAREYLFSQVLDYVRLLKQAGVLPMFRESEGSIYG